MIPKRETAELLVGSGVAAALTIGYLVYVGRVVGSAEYSDFAAALSAIYFVGLTFGPLTPTIARLTAQYRSRGSRSSVAMLRRTALCTAAAVGGVVAIGGSITSLFVSEALHFRTAAPLIVAFVAVFLYAIVSVDRGLVQGLLFFRAYNANVIAEAAVRLAAAAVLILFAQSALAALTAYAVALAVAELDLSIRLRRESIGAEPSIIDWSAVQSLAVPMIVLMFAIAACQNTTMLAVKRWFVPRDAGAYGAATAVARGFGVIFAPFYVLAGPLLTSLHESGRSICGMTLRLTASFLASTLVPLSLLAMWPDVLLRALYGLDFLAAAPVIAPLCGVTIVTYAGLMLAQALVTLRDFRFLCGYLLFALLQVVGLILFHATYTDVLRVLYFAQTAALLSVSFFFARAWRRDQPAVTTSGLKSE